MKSDTPLDYAVFQLSPRHSRCELFVSSDGTMEKIASGSVKPFVAHLKAVEEQVAQAVNSIKLEVKRHKNVENWFTKGTLERFVRFVSTPDVLELVNTFDAEMSQLEAARKIYSQGAGSQISDGKGASSAAEATKKELLKAIDVRLDAVSQDLTKACADASAAGFDHDIIPELQLFADYFGAHSLNEACIKYLSVHQRRPNLLLSNKTQSLHIRSSCESDMSIDEDAPIKNQSGPPQAQYKGCASDPQHGTAQNQSKTNAATCQQPKTFPPQHNSTSTDANNAEHANNNNKQQPESESSSSQPAARRLSVQDRINLFESKQKENSGGAGKPINVGKPAELRRLSSDTTSSSSVLRRWSGTSDMSVDSGVAADKKDSKESKGLSDTALSAKVGSGSGSGSGSSSGGGSNNWVESDIDRDDEVGSNGSVNIKAAQVRSFGIENKEGSEGKSSKVVGEEKNGGVEDQVGCGAQWRKSPDRTGPVKLNNHVSDGRMGQLGSKASRGHSRSSSGLLDDPSVVNVGETYSKAGGSDQVKSRSKWKSYSSEVEVSPKESISSVQQPSKLGDSVVPKMKPQKPLAVNPEPLKNTQVRREESGLVYNKQTVSGKMIPDNPDSYDFVSTTPVEQAQRVRQSKGNQELNDELKMKASELEKLFAEHKLRAPSDQASSSRKNKQVTIQKDLEVDLQYRKSDAAEIPQKQYENKAMFTPPDKMLKFSTDSKIPKDAKIDYSETLRKSFPRIGFSDDSRGKYYEKYMQKRNAKLSDEWTSKRAEKEARLKAMQDSLEQSRAAMKAKFSGFADKQGSVSGSHSGRRSFNADSLQRTEQNEEDEPLTQLDTFSGDTAFRSAQVKKPLANKTRAAPIPRSSVASSTHPGRWRMQSEKPLAETVPNFSDFRKENTKPSSGASRMVARTQMRNHARTKSSTENEAQVYEEKQKRSQSLRKSYMGPLKDISDSSYDGDVLEPMRASTSDERLDDDDDLDDATFEEEEEEPEAIQKEYPCPVEKSTQCTDSHKLDYSEAGFGDALMSQVDPTSVHELAPPVSVESLCDSHGESPTSSRMHDRFPYPQETSDIDASADSPRGSPAYWNSHLLSQTEDGVDGMRKKWQSAQKTVIVSNSSQSHSRKDVTKGFKRLLKFGRKNRGTENLADWVSVTTSEGDDDTDDGRDPASRSSEDFRKSRMGFSQGQSSDDGFNESELFTDQVQATRSSIPAPPANFKLREEHVSGSSIKAPKSFFSLSTFRSKGSDPKAR